MELILSNGTTLTANEGSTLTNIVILTSSYTVVDEITPENLNGATLDGEKIANSILDSVTATGISGDNIVITITQHSKTEIQLMQEQITELQEAVTELTEILFGDEEEEEAE